MFALRGRFVYLRDFRFSATKAIMSKVFTVEEANALLPQIRALVEEMFTLREEALAMLHTYFPTLRADRDVRVHAIPDEQGERAN